VDKPAVAPGEKIANPFSHISGRAAVNIWELLLLLVVAGVCGSIAQAIVGYSRGGCLVSIVLGFIGALLGAWLARRLGLPELLTLEFGNQPFPVIWSIIGASLFVALLSLISGRRRTRW
jgi:uncharacterized membrane protein YeaQ/YmgE (transglycosylase-associated protein family)